jgi:hypothetical protein
VITSRRTFFPNAASTAARVIAFPRERCRISSGKIRGAVCTVIILPVIHIARWPEEPNNPARKRKSKRKTP